MSEGEPAEPNTSPPSLRRGAFVAFGSAAAAAVTSNAIAGTQANSESRTAEADPSIVVFKPVMISANRQINSYAAVPKDAPAGTPGVVVAMHLWGVDAQIRDTVRRLAKAGYVAIAPDLYSSFGPPSGDGVTEPQTFIPLAKQLKPEEVTSDLAAGAQWIRTRLPGDQSTKARVGILGFCMGGAIVLRQTIANPGIYDAASAFYGTPASLDPKAVKVPLLGSYGKLDKGIPAADVSAFFDGMVWPRDLKIYPDAGHAFFDDTRASYVPPDAHDAWKRTLHWFGYYLKQGA